MVCVGEEEVLKGVMEGEQEVSSEEIGRMIGVR